MFGKSILWVPGFSALFLASLSCAPAPAQTAPKGIDDTQPTMVLHMESREALLDVVARDRHNLPITDLSANEFEVYEVPKHGHPVPRRVLYIRTVDPERRDQEVDATSGFHVSSGAICALDAAVHYQIAIQASSEPGYHTVLVKTKRPQVNLSFRRQYYVGFSRENAAPKDLARLVTPEALQEAACYHSLTPPTLAITAKVLDAPAENTTRYAVVIKPASLSDIGINGAIPRVQLDFGVCVFGADGEVTNYLHSTIDHQLNAADLARVTDHGFVSLLEAPGPQPPALVRLAVLDRNTGNLGVVDVSRPLAISDQTSQARRKRKLIGDVRAFGSVTPKENAFCGDVYELPPGTSSVEDLGELDPVGSLYTNILNVPNQDITEMGGIPGITHSSVWFGIDYYGKLYITKPGRYSFKLLSDDGARLEIDNRVLIDLDGVHQVDVGNATIPLSGGWHSIHVPYFQGPPTALALVLLVKPPDEEMHVLNLNDFVPAAGVVLPQTSIGSVQPLTVGQRAIVETARAKYYDLESRGLASASCTVNFDFKTIPLLQSENPAADRALLEKTKFSLDIGRTEKVKIQYPKAATEEALDHAAGLASLLRELVQAVFQTWGTTGFRGPLPASGTQIESATAAGSGYTILSGDPDDPARIELDKDYLVTEIVSNGGRIDEKPSYDPTPDGLVFAGSIVTDRSSSSDEVVARYELGSQSVDGFRLPSTVRLRINKNNIDARFSLNDCIVTKRVAPRETPLQENP